jgi:hypothetical protein
MPPDHVFILRDAEAGLIRNLDEPLVDDGFSMPSTRSCHHGTSREWFSQARKFSVAAAQWTLAKAPIGVPA